MADEALGFPPIPDAPWTTMQTEQILLSVTGSAPPINAPPTPFKGQLCCPPAVPCTKTTGFYQRIANIFNGLLRANYITQTGTTTFVINTGVQPFTPKRVPGPLDDASQGYRAGNLWVFNNILYIALSVTANTAVWLQVSGTVISSSGSDTTNAGVTLVNTGQGLTGGPITTQGTISIAAGAVTAAMLASGVGTGSGIQTGSFSVTNAGFLAVPGIPTGNLVYLCLWNTGANGIVYQATTNSAISGNSISYNATMNTNTGVVLIGAQSAGTTMSSSSNAQILPMTISGLQVKESVGGSASTLGFAYYS